MSIERIDDPVGFIASLGGLHDVRVQSLKFLVETKKLIFSTDDLNANFTELDEYPGRRPCDVVLLGISEFLADMEIVGGLWISAATVTKRTGGLPGYRLEFDLSDGGGATSRGARSIQVVFSAMEIHED